MNFSKYVIDPCSSCVSKYGITDINNINQCCYDTIGAFTGNVSLNSFRDNKSVMDVCDKCVQSSMKALGRDPCEFRLTPYPSWIQAPHHFPQLLNSGLSPEEALGKCNDMCTKNRYPNQCMDNCQMDFNSLKRAPADTNIEKYENDLDVEGDKENKNDNERKHNVVAMLTVESSSQLPEPRDAMGIFVVFILSVSLILLMISILRQLGNKGNKA